VLVALAVGDQQAIPAEQWRLFRQTGVIHLMSISGLHVTMVAALFAAVIGWLWRRGESLMLLVPAQKAAIAAGWLAAFVYALIAGFSVPTQRTLYMLTVVALALWSGRNLGASRSLLLALLPVLLLDPWAVLAPGFWLSFAAVGLLFFVGTARVGVARGWRSHLPTGGRRSGR
jgi:competence protein ComEC